MRISSPQPSVLHLVTLFRMISSGEVRIPAFQRNFVWTEKQMVELLDSVNEGFPIGSILLWGVDHKILRIAPSGTTSFPDVEERFPTNYVLDGMQRLSTLYGAFNYGSATLDRRFDILFDLVAGTFANRAKDDVIPPTSVPLSALFVPRSLLDHQSRISKLNNSDELLEKLLSVQAAFQEYMLPVVTIRSDDIQRVVGIFEKINSTGTRLDPVDFMRAITWAEDFDLNHYLDAISRDLSEVGAPLSPETLIKCVGLTMGIPPTTEGLLKLRATHSNVLSNAFANATYGLRRVLEFLRDSLNIFSSELVPYEGQMLLLFRAIGMGEAHGPEAGQIIRWFWATGFNEALRGKPDHYVVRAIENWKGLVNGAVRGLEPRLKLTEIELYERRLVSGGALSSTFAAMFAANGAADLVDGLTLHPSLYMTGSDLSDFQVVFSRAELVSGGLPDTISARIFGNVVLFEGVASPEAIRAAIVEAADREEWEVLASQFIDQVAVSALVQSDVQTFIRARVHLMHLKAKALVEA